jgi:ribosomal protein RSM22 (predicted rRNA methylase)
MAQWPSLRSLAAWEREPAFIALGRELARSSSADAIRSTRWERVDLRLWAAALERRDEETRRPGQGDKEIRRQGDKESSHEQQIARDRRRTTDNELRMYDLVVLGHVLNELALDDRRRVVARAWQMTDGLLLIVEPGASAAFGVVRAARDELLAAGARTIAPCAHDRPCPLQDDWCHFPQRLKRPDFQRRARAAPSEWEDSKFSYAAMARFAPDAPIWGRVIREPTSNKAYAEATISSPEGVARYRGLKRHREAFRLVKALEWGAVLTEPLPEPIARVDSDK